jgi:dihydrofolate reductase / thymidylate synthase
MLGNVLPFDIVVAADLDWGIGKDNALPWPRLKGDLAHFRRVTSTAPEGRRNAIVMGRKTWESREVAGKPLPRRLNVVISRRGVAVPAGVVVASSLDTALGAARATPDVEAVFVIGGGEILREALGHPGLRWVYLTRIEVRYGCDATIPDLDRLGFTPTAWEGEQAVEDEGVRYRFERLAPPALTPRPGT